MTRARSERVRFPVGLYASLLVALFCLVRPEFSVAIERLGAAAVCLPLRAWAWLSPGSALAGASPTPDDMVAAARIAELDRRAIATLSRARPALRAPDGEAVACRVVARAFRGAAGIASVLVLDRCADELAAPGAPVTADDALIGFVAANADDGRGAAQVLLLHHRPRTGLPRRVPAEVELPSGEVLSFLVEPATAIDTWPLRCALLDDPYLAARLSGSRLAVVTSGFGEDPLGPLARGLAIGTLEVWGYERAPGQRPLPIEFYVAPTRHADDVHRVVVWRRGRTARTAAGVPGPFDGGVVWPTRLLRVPVARSGGERWLLSTVEPGVSLRPGAALVAGPCWLGTVVTAGPGFAVARPFGEHGDTPIAMTLLPDAPDVAPIDFRAVATARIAIEQRDGAAAVRLRLLEPARELVPGQVFTGATGPDAPGGLWIGRLSYDAPSESWVVEHTGPTPGRALGVFRRDDAGEGSS